MDLVLLVSGVPGHPAISLFAKVRDFVDNERNGRNIWSFSKHVVRANSLYFTQPGVVLFLITVMHNRLDGLGP